MQNIDNQLVIKQYLLDFFTETTKNRTFDFSIKKNLKKY